MKQTNSAIGRFVDHTQNSHAALSQSWNSGGYGESEERLYDDLGGEQQHDEMLLQEFQGFQQQSGGEEQQARFAEVLAEAMSAPSPQSIQQAQMMAQAYGPDMTHQVASEVAGALGVQQDELSRLFEHMGEPQRMTRRMMPRMRPMPYGGGAGMMMHQMQARPPPPMKSVPRPDAFKGLDRAYEQQAAQDRLDQEDRLSGEETDEWFSGFLKREDDLSSESFRKIASRLAGIKDDKLQNSQWMQFVRDLGDGSARIVGNQVVQGRLREESPFEEMERVWRQAAEQHDDMQEVLIDTDAGYQFSDNGGRYNEIPDLFRMGMELFESGRFSDAILAFEEEVRQHPEHARAWHLLGKCHQEGDADDQAIAALHKCIELDQTLLDALLDLAVSYTNNMRKDLALDVLQSWLHYNPKYTHLVPVKPGAPIDLRGGDVEDMLRSLYEKQDKTIQLFIQAALMSPEDVDADVQIALGLLFNLSLDYERAVECFKAALSVKTDDYALWNKLGATLANSNRSEEAMQAYFQALERKPLYVRARANLGISFLSLKLFSEAAKQFLSALSIQPEAEHIWSNLETAFAFMQRQDLLEKARRMDVNLFRSDFDF